MDEKKMTKIMIGAAVVIALATGGFAIYNHSVNAKEAVAKQEVMANIEKQQAQEEAAQQAKAKDPKVDESHPGRYVAPADQAASTEKAQSTGTSSSQKIPTQTPATTTTPPAQPKAEINQDAEAAITSLSGADIQRLQSYPVDSNGELYVSFNDMFSNEKAECDAVLSKFSPTTLSTYNKAKAGWLTSPRLVYIDSYGNYVVRGILSLTYYGDNAFGLTPNVTYQREAEYSLDNSVTNGKVTLKLASIKYLSGFKAVK